MSKMSGSDTDLVILDDLRRHLQRLTHLDGGIRSLVQSDLDNPQTIAVIHPSVRWRVKFKHL